MVNTSVENSDMIFVSHEEREDQRIAFDFN